MVKFVNSYISYRSMIHDEYNEFAFIGRSNVGKSSLINLVLNTKNLSKVSSQPGKTQTINQYIYNNLSIVDLPGYGWAKVPKSIKDKWEPMIYNYLRYRKNLKMIFLLLDSRLDIQKNDITMLEFLNNNNLNFSIILTKIDKVGSTTLDQNAHNIINQINQIANKDYELFTTSSEKKIGRDEIIKYLQSF